MLRLENEVDPKITQPKHLKDKKILVRRGDEIFISNVFMTDGICFVYYSGTFMEIFEMDGWTKLPVVNYL